MFRKFLFETSPRLQFPSLDRRSPSLLQITMEFDKHLVLDLVWARGCVSGHLTRHHSRDDLRRLVMVNFLSEVTGLVYQGDHWRVAEHGNQKVENRVQVSELSGEDRSHSLDVMNTRVLEFDLFLFYKLANVIILYINFGTRINTFC